MSDGYKLMHTKRLEKRKINTYLSRLSGSYTKVC